MDRLLGCNQLDPLEFRRYRHPNRPRRKFHRYRGRMDRFHSIHRNAR